MREIEENTRRWKNIPCSWIIKNIVKMSYHIESRLEYRLNSISHQNSDEIFKIIKILNLYESIKS